MSNGLLLLPDFLLIACGFLLCRYTALDRPVWESAERLVYYLLFPVLLFNSIVKTPLQPAQTVGLAAAGVGVMLCGIVLAFSLRAWPGVDARLHASGAQIAFRFNSYVALALSERLGGAQGVAWMALLIALCVPIANVAAVWSLARQGGHNYLREIARNPLIISTVAGLLANAAGVQFPEAVATTLQRIGVAALPIGLLAVGAGLRLGGLKQGPVLAATLLGIRHAVLPAIAVGLTLWLIVLPPAQRHIVVLFAGPYVAGLVTLSTLLGMLSIPIWLAMI
jgi:predicted permease